MLSIGIFFTLAHAQHRRDHVDACDKQLPGVLPSPGVTRPRRVAVGEIVHQRH